MDVKYLKEIIDLEKFILHLDRITNLTIIVDGEDNDRIYKFKDVELFTIPQRIFNDDVIYNEWIDFTEFGKQFIKTELINFIKNN